MCTVQCSLISKNPFGIFKVSLPSVMEIEDTRKGEEYVSTFHISWIDFFSVEFLFKSNS